MNIWDKIVNFFSPNSNCSCKRNDNDYCESISTILKMTKKEFNKEVYKKLYEDLLNINRDSLNISEKNLTQIKKDLGRTFPGNKFYQNEKTQEKMKNILIAFTNYYTEISYYQGMNFIVGFFLYHCEDYVAFWLFTSLIEEYGFRDLYCKNFPGLDLHTKTIILILKRNYIKIYNAFDTLKVNVRLLLMEWLYSLFSSLIPLELQLNFYLGFYSQGWEFFYKMCISCFLNLEGSFKCAEEVYIALKFGKGNNNPDEIYEVWKNIIQKAYQIEYNV